MDSRVKRQRKTSLGHSPKEHARRAKRTGRRVIEYATQATYYAKQQNCSTAFKKYETALEMTGAMTANMLAVGRGLSFNRSRAAVKLAEARRALGDKCIYLGGR